MSYILPSFIKDLFFFWCFVLFFSYFIFFDPNVLGHPDNYIEANPMVTPAHIVPEWYFLPFYAILRSIPHKLGGVIALFTAEYFENMGIANYWQSTFLVLGIVL